MCLCVLILPSEKNPDLFIVGNRDEDINRPTAPLSRLENGIYCGVDLVRGGTWLGAKPNSDNSSIRFAFLTNFREVSLGSSEGPSRGLLPMTWLSSEMNPEEFLVSQDFSNYSGMNLVIGISYVGKEPLIYATSNRGVLLNDGRFESLEYGPRGATYSVRFRSEHPSNNEPFVVALCNGSLGEDWVKVTRCEERAKTLNDYSDEALLNLMQDATPSSQPLPKTGFGDEIEQLLSPMFIQPVQLLEKPYGTRTTTLIRVTPTGALYCIERNHFDGHDICVPEVPEVSSENASVS
eukprot:CAMPEP_0114350064 /NCGR_PEP_ID=MMETSP0101-20121206/16042_1 /TAXON_ID=38822 ORGANISM="Pteridomonas danica, Strain PT" /NCGR_SAMPLE_ID=MMETSP0101 /ASSEMBLY_ACC=CAM_ASM_000211 /LENGTH=292 /DNA_ID=CAMNT_0001489031 /DNA_START=12 /DNA_END=890 /DNA_ORIENTATION=-